MEAGQGRVGIEGSGMGMAGCRRQRGQEGPARVMRVSSESCALRSAKLAGGAPRSPELRRWWEVSDGCLETTLALRTR